MSEPSNAVDGGLLGQPVSSDNPVLTTQNANAHIAPGSSVAVQSVPEDGWFVEVNGARRGPMGLGNVTSLLASGLVGHGTLVWRTGMSDWAPLANSTLGYLVRDLPPPLVGDAVSNGYVWVLAFAPLIGNFLAGVLWGATGIPVASFWWVTLALNIVLCIADEKQLKAAGHNTAATGPAWLIPVYLHKRAALLKQSNAYLIVWVICFVLSFF